MPPPSYCSKISTQSTNDHATDNDFNNSRSETSNFAQAHSNLDFKTTLKNETVGFVKTLLGPSLEDAVLKTLEFGKALIQKSDGFDSVSKEKKLFESIKKEFSDDPQKQLHLNFILEKGKKISEMKEDKNFLKGKSSRKSVMFNKEKDKKVSIYQKTKKPLKKLANVSKIRSLDSDLKQKTLSPEKIKRQLEALIQINKDVPPEHAFNWSYCSKRTKIPVEMTVMPSLCMYDKTDLSNLPSYEAQCNASKLDCSEDPATSKAQSKKRQPNKICQAPEFLSNALGPTLDVSLIDNIKMMRDIFKCDSARGEEPPKRPPICQQTKQEVRLQNSEAEMTCRIDELHRKIEELEQKERCLAKQIEDEEQERENRRRAFEEEEKKLCNMKTCFDEIPIEKKKEYGASLMECNFEAKYESLQTRVALEEEKLLRLKAQNENYKREITEAKNRKEVLKVISYDAIEKCVKIEQLHVSLVVVEMNIKPKYRTKIDDVHIDVFIEVNIGEHQQNYNFLLYACIQCFQRNKALLDAWDVFASRVCHTRLPSFSRVYTLERKDFKMEETGNLHCCFPVINPSATESTKSTKCNKSRSRCQSSIKDCQSSGSTPTASQCFGKNESRSECRCGNNETSSCCKDHVKNESMSNIKCKIKSGEVQFPIQRDITCGLHQMMKICSCKYKEPMKHEGHTCSSEDELFKRCKAMETGNKKENYFSSLGLDSSTEIIVRKGSKEKVPCRSKSDTSLKEQKCSRIVKVMWATTRINIFQDNCRTYEIMDATSKAPTCLPAKTEGIFVVKTPQKKVCPSFSKRKCPPSVP